MFAGNDHITYFENQFACFWIDSNILFIIFKENVCLDIIAAKQIVSDRILIQDTRPFLILCDIDGVVSTTKAARDYFSSLGYEFVKAIAFVTSSTFHKNLLADYLNRHVVPVPTVFYSDSSKAIKFLQSPSKKSQ